MKYSKRIYKKKAKNKAKSKNYGGSVPSSISPDHIFTLPAFAEGNLRTVARSRSAGVFNESNRDSDHLIERAFKKNLPSLIRFFQEDGQVNIRKKDGTLIELYSFETANNKRNTIIVFSTEEATFKEISNPVTKLTNITSIDNIITPVPNLSKRKKRISNQFPNSNGTHYIGSINNGKADKSFENYFKKLIQNGDKLCIIADNTEFCLID